MIPFYSALEQVLNEYFIGAERYLFRLCSALSDKRTHLRHALDAVDAVVGNLGPLPAPMAAMLFQNEAQISAAPVLKFNAVLSCPKIGLSLASGGADLNPLTAPLPDEKFGSLEALLTDVSCVLGSSGRSGYAIADIHTESNFQNKVFPLNNSLARWNPQHSW